MLFRLALIALLLSPPARAEMPCADVALVLAIDASGSIDPVEFALQTTATARALSDPEVVAAMQAVGGVALAAVIWGDAAYGTQRLSWALVDGPAPAERFAARLAGQSRAVAGNTDLGVGLGAALDLLEDPGNCASRRIVNVSGDGRETPLFRQSQRVTLAASRARAERMGVTVNGLAITAQDAGLAGYYRDKVALGSTSFVVEVADTRGFADAMKRKLLREIGEPARISSLEMAGLALR